MPTVRSVTKPHLRHHADGTAQRCLRHVAHILPVHTACMKAEGGPSGDAPHCTATTSWPRGARIKYGMDPSSLPLPLPLQPVGPTAT